MKYTKEQCLNMYIMSTLREAIDNQEVGIVDVEVGALSSDLCKEKNIWDRIDRFIIQYANREEF